MTDLIFSAVYSPDELIESYTQSKLNGLWWKNFLELAYEDNTLFWDDSNIGEHPYNNDADPDNDVTLTDLAQKNQLDGIQFLAGVFNESGTATRTIYIDPESILFFPILNTVWVPEEGDNGYPGSIFEEVKAALNENMDNVEDLFVSIDNLEIPDIVNYRQDPMLEDEFLIETGGLVEDPNYDILGPTYSSGYYIGLNPLPPELGGHTIHFEGVITSNGFELDLTYNIRYDFNEVFGTDGKDKNLLGTDKSDHIQGLDGKDTILGLTVLRKKRKSK
jgi:hypothetical protein